MERVNLVLYILIIQSMLLVLITVFCITVTIYGYPLVDGGLDSLKNDTIREVKILVGDWKSDIIVEVKGLLEDLAQRLAQGTEGLNITELNLAVAKINRFI